MKNIGKDNGAIPFELNIQTHTLINFHNFFLVQAPAIVDPIEFNPGRLLHLLPNKGINALN